MFKNELQFQKQHPSAKTKHFVPQLLSHLEYEPHVAFSIQNISHFLYQLPLINYEKFQE